MAMPTQAKVQLLGALVVAFTLLSVPLFYQVRSDATADKSQVKDTALSKFFSKLTRDARSNPDKDVEVEDYWGEYTQENPCRGANCGADDDKDRDGVSNEDEARLGTNPECNEDEEEWPGYCAGAPNPDTGELPRNTTEPLNDVLYHGENLAAGSPEDFPVTAVGPDYDRWRVEWRVVGYQGVSGYRIVLADAAGGTEWCCDQDAGPGLLGGSTDTGTQTLEAAQDARPPSGAVYRVAVESGAFSGAWEITIRGIRDAA